MNAVNFLRILILAGVFAATFSNACADEAALIKQAEENANAILKGDYAKIVDYTHPEVVEGMGGRESAIALTRRSMQQVESQGIKLVSVKNGKPSEIVLEGNELVAIVPYTMRSNANGKAITLESFVFGMSIPGTSRWVFMDGTTLSKEKIALRYPMFASKVSIPKVWNSLEDEIWAISDKMKKETGKTLKETVDERLAPEYDRLYRIIDSTGLRATIEREQGKKLKEIPLKTLKEILKAKGYE
jgi:hypothetical protein